MRLIIAEKPSAAERIALALAGKKVEPEGKKVPYYDIKNNGEKIIIVPARGHLYTVDTDRKGIPILSGDLKWVPLEKRKRKETGRFIKCFKKFTDADEIIVATDYDTEGSLIGYNIIKFILNRDPSKAKRMIFSSLTSKELTMAYNTLAPMDISQAIGGQLRHEVDFLFGVTLSRALMHSLKSAGRFTMLSVGRVQSPTLAFVYKREQEIKTFVPLPYWSLTAQLKINSQQFVAEGRPAKIQQESEAKERLARCGEYFTVEEIKQKNITTPPPVPMNLSALQSMAYSVFGFSPSKTLKIAERLYLAALISYPRTESEQFPESINLAEIIEQLKMQKQYSPFAEHVLHGAVIPTKGKKIDSAHPPIHPTGEVPDKLSRDEMRLYDLIVRHFLSLFYEEAVKRSTILRLINNSEKFVASGMVTVNEGWTIVMKPFIKSKAQSLPVLSVGDKIKGTVQLVSKYSSPPARYNPASLLKKMEKEEIGTKATRADTIETLYSRGYIEERAIKITELGEIVVEIMARFFPEIIDVQMTRNLEREIELVMSGEKLREDVLKEVDLTLLEITKKFEQHKQEIGHVLAEYLSAMRSRQRIVGKCPKCGKDLLLIRSKKTGKFFVGCSGYFDGTCDFSAPLPQGRKLRTTDKKCPHCGAPMVEYLTRRGWRAICVNWLNCPGYEKIRASKRDRKG